MIVVVLVVVVIVLFCGVAEVAHQLAHTPTHNLPVCSSSSLISKSAEGRTRLAGGGGGKAKQKLKVETKGFKR